MLQAGEKETEKLPALESEKTLPTQVHELDERIEFLKKEIDNLQIQMAEANFDRKRLVTRAKEIVALDDGRWKLIDVPVYPKKRVNVEALRHFEEKYELILANIRERLRDKVTAEMNKAESFISQADVNAVIRDRATLDLVIPEPTEPDHYETVVVARK